MGEQERATILSLGKHMRVLGRAAEDVPDETWAADWIEVVDWSAVDVAEEGKLQSAEVMAADVAFFAQVSRFKRARWLLIRPLVRSGLGRLPLPR